MGTRGPLPSPLRDYVLALARRGDLGTLREVALLGGVTTTRAYVWLRDAGIDLKAARARYLVRLHRRASMIADGKRPKRRSKAQMRELAVRAKRKWDQDREAELEKQG